MSVVKDRLSPFFIAVVTVICVTVGIIVIVASCTAKKLTFETEFYFVCYSIEDNAVSAGSISDAVSSFGGAGYVLEYGGAYYVTVSCYYRKSDADKVCESLKRRELDCQVLKIETSEYHLSFTSNANLYLGNLNTLQSLSRIAYDCANKLDTGEYGQNQAKTVVINIESGIKGLLNSNSDNCFTPYLRALTAICDDAKDGIIFSKHLRKLQIAMADAIINVKLI